MKYLHTLAALAAFTLSILLTGCGKEELDPPATQAVTIPATTADAMRADLVTISADNKPYGTFPRSSIIVTRNAIIIPSCEPLLNSLPEGCAEPPLQPSCNNATDVACAAASGHATRRDPQTDTSTIEIGIPELGSICRTNWPKPHSWDCGYDMYDPPYFAAGWKCNTVSGGHEMVSGNGKSTKKDIRVCFRNPPPAEVASEIVKTFSSGHYVDTRASAMITTHLNGGKQSGFAPGEGWREVKP